MKVLAGEVKKSTANRKKQLVQLRFGMGRVEERSRIYQWEDTEGAGPQGPECHAEEFGFQTIEKSRLCRI